MAIAERLAIKTEQKDGRIATLEVQNDDFEEHVETLRADFAVIREEVALDE